MTTYPAPTLYLGDEVRLTALFLRNVGMFSDPHGPGWGVVVEPPKEGDVLRLARVRWPDGHVAPVRVTNLQKRGETVRPGVDFDLDTTGETRVD